MMLLMSDDLIKSKVFQVPNTDKKLIQEMKNLFSVKTKSNFDVYGTLIKSDNEHKSIKTVIYSHGTGNDIYNVFHLLKAFSDKFGVDLICYDYPGYGLVSAEKMDEEGCYECHEAVINYAINDLKIDKENIILVGQSLGTGVVVDYISNNPWNNLVILLSPYKSIPRIILDDNFADNLADSIKKYQFNSLNKINKATCPIKIFHGDKDELIPINHAKDLYEKITNKSHQLEIINNAGHTDVMFKIDDDTIKSLLNKN